MPDVVTVPPLATKTGVDILATGTWKLSSGEATFTKDDLANAVEASQCPAVGPPRIKLGHIDPRFDGEPAVGYVANMSLAAEGNKITGDLTGMPGWLGEIIASAYPNRSIEGNWGFQCQIGHTHPFVITGLALLGVSAPGVGVLGELKDVAALYGIEAARRAAISEGTHWHLEVTSMTDPVMAAGVTTEDVRRAYYASPNAGYSYWITEMQMDPPQLIVADEATNKVFRVPVTIKNGEVTFGEALEVQVEYVDVPKSKQNAAGRLRFASAADSRAGVEAAWDGGAMVKNMGDNPSKSQLGKMFALPGDSKSSSKLPHHTCSPDGTVGGPDQQGCSAAIGALNGARGGLTNVSAEDKQKAYNHLAAHLRSLGQEPPEFTGSAEPDTEASAEEETEPDADAGAGHGVLGSADEPVEHSHSHTADGSQGGDKTHTHSHSHAGDKNHAHAHQAEAGNERKSDVNFTEEQKTSLRASLGLDEEFDEAALVEAAAKLKATKVSASARQLPQGVIAVEQEAWNRLNAAVKAGEEFRHRQLVKERDTVIAAAIKDGKFSPARRQHWVRLWDADPEGTREVLAGLQKNVVPMNDIGTSAGDEDELLDEEYKNLFPPAATRE